jgi:prolipoprotein diacylglyceryltransferase
VALNEAFEEFLARRQRMQKHFKPFFGGLLEFAFFGGLVVGVMAAFLGRWYGVLPFLAFLIGYGLLERRRQAALTAGQGEEVVRRQYDRLTFAMTAALAILGLWVFSGALRAKDAEGWVDRSPPPKTINLDLVTE